MRRDQKNARFATSAVRMQLKRELPEIPRELADEADMLTLTFLAAVLMGPCEYDCQGAH